MCRIQGVSIAAAGSNDNQVQATSYQTNKSSQQYRPRRSLALGVYRWVQDKTKRRKAKARSSGARTIEKPSGYSTPVRWTIVEIVNHCLRLQYVAVRRLKMGRQGIGQVKSFVVGYPEQSSARPFLIQALLNVYCLPVHT